MTAIDICQLSKHYGRRIGVDNLSLQVDEGVLYGFLGPNGSGKTTAIRIMLGLLRADKGVASLFGLDSWHDGREIRKGIGYVPGDLRLYPWMTCRNAMAFSSRIRGEDYSSHGMDLADLLGLDPKLPVSRMSRGTRQKLGLILALAHQPRLLILDEPTTGLDPLVQESFFSYIRDYAQKGRTVFFSSHTLSEVERLCDQVGIIRNGSLVASETLSSLRQKASRRITIQWAKDVDAREMAPPDNLYICVKEKHRWEADISESVMDFIRWSARQPIQDMSISPPDLNSLFQKYYHYSES